MCEQAKQNCIQVVNIQFIERKCLGTKTRAFNKPAFFFCLTFKLVGTRQTPTLKLKRSKHCQETFITEQRGEKGRSGNELPLLLLSSSYLTNYKLQVVVESKVSQSS